MHEKQATGALARLAALGMRGAGWTTKAIGLGSQLGRRSVAGLARLPTQAADGLASSLGAASLLAPMLLMGNSEAPFSEQLSGFGAATGTIGGALAGSGVTRNRFRGARSLPGMAIGALLGNRAGAAAGNAAGLPLDPWTNYVGPDHPYWPGKTDPSYSPHDNPGLMQWLQEKGYTVPAVSPAPPPTKQGEAVTKPFFFHLGRNLQKEASTALVRAIQAGKLAAPSIQRAAKAMAPGKFRFLGNLGRGQFNVADKVVGNVGGHAGEMVRKLPAHAYVDPQDAYKGLKEFVDKANKQLPTATGVPAVAPYTAVNSRGAFQRIGNQSIHTPESFAKNLAEESRSLGVPKGWLNQDAIAKMPAEGAANLMGDLHPGNIGPGGQIIDFAAPGIGWAPNTARRISSDTARLSDRIPGGWDTMANVTDPTRKQLAQNNGINNSIRAFYAQSPAQRAAAIPSLGSLPATTPVPSGPAGWPSARSALSGPRPIQPRRPPAPGQGIMRPKPRPPFGSEQGSLDTSGVANQMAQDLRPFMTPSAPTRWPAAAPAAAPPPSQLQAMDTNDAWNMLGANHLRERALSAPPSPGSFHPRSGFGPQDSFGSAPPVPSPRGPRIGRWLAGGLLGGGALGGGAAIGSGLLNSGGNSSATPPPTTPPAAPPLPPPAP
jgi:hypothetical protein